MIDQFVDANKMAPITPPPELVQQWIEQGVSRPPNTDYMMWFATQAARWGADQELEACIEWIGESPVIWHNAPEAHPGSYLREARRPEPPSLKEQALKELAWVDKNLKMPLLNQCEAIHTIRRALEALPND